MAWTDAGACGICGRILDWATDQDGSNGHWVHTAQDRINEDHEPLWVPENAILPTYRCDFCNQDNPEFELPSKDFTIAFATESSGVWTCCATCLELITADKWPELVERSIDMSEPILTLLRDGDASKAEIRQFLTGMYAELKRNLTGPPRPLTRGIPDGS